MAAWIEATLVRADTRRGGHIHVHLITDQDTCKWTLTSTFTGAGRNMTLDAHQENASTTRRLRVLEFAASSVLLCPSFVVCRPPHVHFFLASGDRRKEGKKRKKKEEKIAQMDRSHGSWNSLRDNSFPVLLRIVCSPTPFLLDFWILRGEREEISRFDGSFYFIRVPSVERMRRILERNISLLSETMQRWKFRRIFIAAFAMYALDCSCRFCHH